MRLRQIFATALVTSLAINSSAVAQSFPSKLVTIVITVSAGSGTDFLARLLAEDLQKIWSVPVVVKAQPGGGGILGVNEVKSAPPDGYTILLSGPPLYTTRKLFKELPYDPIKDFRPIVRVASSYLTLVASPTAPYNSLKELVDYAKKNPPDSILYGSTSAGTTPHLSGVMLNMMAGIKLKHVTYKNVAQTVTDTANGSINLTWVAPVTAQPLIEAKTIKSLGGTGPKRSLTIPDDPTFAEQGYPDYEIVSWFGLFARTNTPDDIVKKLAKDIESVSTTPAFTERLKKAGLEPDFMGTDQTTAQLPGLIATMDKVIDEAGLERH